MLMMTIFCHVSCSLLFLMLLLVSRWKGGSSCGLAARDREEEIFTTNWLSTSIFYIFRRSYTLLCKLNFCALELKSASVLNHCLCANGSP